MKDLHIDTYTDTYKTAVADLIVGIQVAEFGIPITLDLQPDLKEISAYYQRNNGNFWVARIGGEVIGTISLLDIGNHQGALRKMFVNKNYRGKEFGVAQSLLDTLIEWCRGRGVKEIFLGTTEKFTRAQRFYEKNGFEEVKMQELPSAFPVMKVDIKFYRLSV